MKLRKLISAVAATAVAVSAFAVSASASLFVVEDAPKSLTSGSGMWMAKIHVPSEGIDYGIDYASIDKIQFQITTDDPDFFEGMFGGAVVASCGPASMTPEDHNWVQQSFWGCVDDDLGINTQDPAQPILAESLGDYTYQVTMQLDETSCLYFVDSPDAYAQVAIMEWGSDLSQIVVKGMQCYNAAGEVVIALDGEGNLVSNDAPAADAPAVEDAPAADDTATEAPAAGDVAGTTDSSKGSPDTGVEDVAVVAGLAIVAAGAVLVSKKRK